MVTAVLGTLVGLAGVEHGIGEILQGPVAPDGLLVPRRHGGLVLIGLSVLLLLVGGGLAPPLMGVVVGAVATRIGAAPHRPVGLIGQAVASSWPWFLAAAVASYLALVPRIALATMLGVASEELVVGLVTFAFANLGLVLWAARVRDRLQAAGNPRRTFLGSRRTTPAATGRPPGSPSELPQVRLRRVFPPSRATWTPRAAT